MQSKWTAAAEQFGGNIKPESYKRGLWVITKKVKDAAEKGELDGVGDSDENAPKKATGGNKRKATSQEVDGGDDADKPKAKKGKGGKRGKKAKTPEAEAEQNGNSKLWES